LSFRPKTEAQRCLRSSGTLAHLTQRCSRRTRTPILAVEKMYESMWRLVVYVSPEAMAQYPVVMASAGKVVFDTMDYDSSYPDEEGWENDKHLATELQRKFGYLRYAVDGGARGGGAARCPASDRSRANTEKQLRTRFRRLTSTNPPSPRGRKKGPQRSTRPVGNVG